MRLLKEIVRTEGLNLAGKTFYREAVRGIIISGERLLMIHSSKDGDYKFPGGGVEEGESYKEALKREIKEESGAEVTDIVKEFGKVIEYDKPLEKEFEVFKMTSYYYFCSVGDLLGEQSLDEYEKDLGFKPTWIHIDEAIAANKAVLTSKQKKTPRWTSREAYVLGLVKEYLR